MPTPAGKSPKPKLLKLPIGDLIDHPDLALIPTLETAAALQGDGPGDENGSDPAADWKRLLTSVNTEGVNQPLEVVKLGKKWGVADGRSRRAAAALLFAGGDQRFTHLTCIQIPAEKVESRAIESLKRRTPPVYVLAYLECLKHEGQLIERHRGRPTAEEVAAEDYVTQEMLAERINCDRTTITDCVTALRYFKGNPDSRKKDEPKVLAGLMNPCRVKSAGEGRKITKRPKERSYDSWRGGLKTFTYQAQQFYKWNQTEADNAKASLAEDASLWPVPYRQMVLEALAAVGDTPTKADAAQEAKRARREHKKTRRK